MDGKNMNGEATEAAGETRDTAGETRDMAGETRQTAGETRETAGETRQTTGETTGMVEELRCTKPGNIEDINPTLIVYYKKNAPLTIDLTSSGEQFVSSLQENGASGASGAVFVCHGFKSNATAKWVVDMKDRLIELNDKDLIVVLVDWRGGADLLAIEYSWAAEKVDVVGEWVGKYAKALRDKYPDMYIHGVGHSLGAHVMGNAGRSYRSFDRITGLDPAGPLFERDGDSHFVEKRLKRDDGKMVDVIHTAGDSPYIGPIRHNGTLIPLGTLDFYPNFGIALQPGVEWNTIAGSHSRSHDYFNWSINNKGAFHTNSVLAGTPEFEKPIKETEYTDITAEMGYYADVTGRHGDTHPQGNYYVKTNEKDPWVTVE